MIANTGKNQGAAAFVALLPADNKLRHALSKNL
jgi:hypothetical protein